MTGRPRSLRRLLVPVMGAVAVVALGLVFARATPITTREGVLPPGTELNEEQLDQPNELFFSELAGGKKSYLLKLGDMLFSSSAILGGVRARPV